MTMQQQQISIDVFDKDNYKKLVPYKQVLTSHDAGWQNIVFEHHRQPPHEMPETNYQQHVLVVNSVEALFEIKMVDRFEKINGTEGDLTLIPANVDYQSADLTENEFFVLAIEPQFLLSNGLELIKSNKVELIPNFSKPDPFVYGTALALKQELEIDYYGCGLYAESLLNALAVHLLRKYNTTKVDVKNYHNGLSRQEIKLVIDYIKANLEEKIGLDALAKITQTSPYYFSRLFKQSTGITPYQYVIQQRIELGKQLLKKEELPIAEIAMMCGFANQSSFTTTFRKLVGVTPKAYQKEF